MGTGAGYKWRKKILGCLILTIVSLCIGGCWDRKELEENHFVLAVAIDSASQGQDESNVESFLQPHGSKRYRLSFQIMDLMPRQSSIGSPQAPQGETTAYVISGTGESLFEIFRDMLGQVSREFWFEHIQAIVISEEVVRQVGLEPIMDFFRRDKQMRWLTKLMITSGQARPLLEYQPPSGEASGMFIGNSLRLYRKNPHIAGWHTDVGDFAKSVDNKSRVLISRVELQDDIVKLGGMALFTGGKFVGYVDEYATQGGKFLSGIEKSAIITTECPEHPGKIIAFELFRHDTLLRPHVDKDKIYYTLDIAMTGNLGEMQCGQLHDTMDTVEIHKLEEVFATEVKDNALYAFHTFQRLKVDADDFSRKLKAYEPLMWEKVKDHWDEKTFPTVSLDVSVQVTIENIGAHK